MITVTGTDLHRLGALIPHTYLGDRDLCSACAQPLLVEIHFWDDRPPRTAAAAAQAHSGPWGRLLDGDDPTGRGADEDAYLATLTGGRA